MTDITNFCPCCVELTRQNEALRAEVQALKAELLASKQAELKHLIGVMQQSDRISRSFKGGGGMGIMQEKRWDAREKLEARIQQLEQEIQESGS